MARAHWFLPEAPDVLGMLGEQSKITVEGLDALVEWASGDAKAAERLRRTEHLADKKKRELRSALTEAFSTPLEPEDIFELSRGLDEILNSAKNIVGEALAMESSPDSATAEMAGELSDGTRHLAEAFSMFAKDDRTGATATADRAVKDRRHLQHTYRRAMSALIENPDPREVAARREIYRRLARCGDEMVRVAERVWYSVLKES
jgi:uncharacterized protein Yka (UPF0111/DUF47 family)